jgi:hypothetical protein
MAKGYHMKRIKRIRQAFDAQALEAICCADEEGDFFAQYGVKHERGGRFYYYGDNGSDILAVAHLDSVQDHRTCDVVQTKAGSKIAFSPTLDDRLGVYVICELLPKMGIKADVLLTTGEETADSSADLFTTDKEYKWMFSFDREGTDVVMYEYRSDDMKDLLKQCGFEFSYGSFSDICELEHLGCKGFNFGVGYHNYHSKRAFVFLDDTFDMVARFCRFHQLHKDTHLVHKQTGRYYGNWWDKDAVDDAVDDNAHRWGAYINGRYYTRYELDKYLAKDGAPFDGDVECNCGHVRYRHYGQDGPCSESDCNCLEFLDDMEYQQLMAGGLN